MNELKRYKNIDRSGVAAALAVQLLLPGPLFALRLPNPGESDAAKSGLEEALEPPPDSDGEKFSWASSEGVWKAGAPSTQIFLDLIKERKGWFRGRDVLEIGTGTGVVAGALAKTGARVVATDIFDAAVSDAGRNLESFLTPEQRSRVVIGKSDVYNDLERVTGNAEDTFDAVIFVNPVERRDTEIIKRAIRELPDVLRPGGRAFFLAVEGFDPEVWSSDEMKSFVGEQLPDWPLDAAAAMLDGHGALLAVYEIQRPSETAGLEELQEMLAQLVPSEDSATLVVLGDREIQNARMAAVLRALPEPLARRILVVAPEQGTRGLNTGNGLWIADNAGSALSVAREMTGVTRLLISDAEEPDLQSLRDSAPFEIAILAQDELRQMLETLFRELGVPQEVLTPAFFAGLEQVLETIASQA